MSNVKIAPSFLTADMGQLAGAVRAVEAAGADYLHLDVMDGHFVPPITFGTLVIEAIRRLTSLPLDVHLMVEQPERHLEAFARAGSDILSVHIEAAPQAETVLKQIRALDCRAGICLNPDTPLSAIEEALAEADQVVVMAVNPGWGGQPFIPGTLPKVQRLRAMLDERGLSPDIEIDGGVKAGNIGSCALAGATVLVAGSAIFNGEASAGDNMRGLRQALTDAKAES